MIMLVKVLTTLTLKEHPLKLYENYSLLGILS